ncbi:MAG: DUF58 domain-containing protein [Rhodocyclaceae bacterium]
MSARAEHLLTRLEWTVIRRLDGLLQGDYRTLMRGSGLDLADLREYQYHDDVRHIDWNVTARLQSPHVRQFTEDRELTAWFLIDLSPSVDFGSRDVRKRSVSTEFVAVLARLLSRHGNRVGALLYGAGVDTVIPPGSSRRHVLRLLHSLQSRPALVRPGATDLRVLLDSALRTVRKRSSIFVLSDFISEPGWDVPLGQLVQRHDVLAIRVLDPLERALPDLGLIVMHDPETGEQLTVDTQNAKFRQRFAALAAAREDDIRQAFARAGVDALELATDDDLIDAIVRFVDLRRRRLALARGSLPQHLKASA